MILTRTKARRGAKAAMKIGLGALLLTGGVADGWAEPAPVTAGPAAAGMKEVEDAGAKKFMMTCAGCHTMGGGKLSGPDLTEASKWPAPELKTAIKRMEKNAGPLSDENIQAVADLLKDPDARQRIQAQGAKMAQMFAATMEPASAEIGRALFEGRVSLKNGGMACSACHIMGSGGETLGPDLSRIHSKMGEVALVSAIEKSGFKIMSAAYLKHPVTRQEAMHLAKHLSQDSPPHTPLAVSAPWKVGSACAVVFLAGMVLFYRPSRGVAHPELKRRRK